MAGLFGETIKYFTTQRVAELAGKQHQYRTGYCILDKSFTQSQKHFLPN